MKPFIKWPGGKTSLLEQLLPLVPASFQVYYEPFLGGGALYFKLAQLRQEGKVQFTCAFLSDINANLMEAYQAVREDIDRLLAQLRKMDQAYQNKIANGLTDARAMYLGIRAKDPLTPLYRAARFIFLNKTCFNGLYRENSEGRFNVPFGKYRKPNICNSETLLAAHAFLVQDFLRVGNYTLVDTAKPGDFIYFDPPYFPIKQGSFTQYGSGQWTIEQHVQLSEFFRKLNNRRVDLVVSNSDTPEVRELYRGQKVIEVWQNRSIGGDKHSRVPRSDLLILSDSLADRFSSRGKYG